MAEQVVCLGCGGLVVGWKAFPDEPRCDCRVEARPAELACPKCGGSLRAGARACPYCSATVATQRCGHCSAWNLAEAEHCQKCGESLDRAESNRSGLSGACPRCSAELAPRAYAELEVVECDACGGIFLEAEMLERLIDARDDHQRLHLALPRRPRAHERQMRYVACPGCKKLMNRTVFGKVSGIIVDSCREHGIWFDSGELADAIAFVDAGGMARARQREIEELEEAKRALKSAEAQHKCSMAMEPASPPMWDFARMIREIWRAL
jgi:Zn-finger nucleic acid-binding protein